MFSQRFTLFRLAGIDIKADLTWFLLATFVATSLSYGWFPSVAEGLPRGSYWFMAIVGTAGLFLSIVLHELCHALVGRSFKMNIKEISLFLFGGVAQLEDEPPTPRAEIMMALAGPAASLGLAAVFFGLFSATRESPPLIPALFSYLYSINVVVALFNMLPGFPLDGGRVLRAILWSIKKDLRWATRIASGVGQLFGVGLIVLGAFSLFKGDPLSGIWSFFLGLLLATFARASYVQLLVRQTFHGKQAAAFMNPRPLTVTAETSLKDLLTDSLYGPGAEEPVVPVVSWDQEVIGCVDLREARKLEAADEGENGQGREERLSRTTARDLMKACTAEMRIGPETDAESALARMSRTGNRLLLVIKDNRLIGVLSQSALVRYLSIAGT